jgi:PERQ amino acid-rich with GYF domain-containing protein
MQPEATKANDKKQPKTAGKSTQQPRGQKVQPMPEPAPSPTPAWGSVAQTQPANRKSMAEIQKEEARAAAIAAMNREGTRSSSSGWANVAAARGGSTAWESGAAKSTPAAVLTNPSGVTPAVAGRSGQPLQTAQGKATGGTQQAGGASAAEEFGAAMSPSLERWCKDQMMKLNGSDDLTLVSFCMTLNDPSEIRQYLAAYLGSTPQVASFATDFINKRGLGSTKQQEEWESTVTTKKGRKSSKRTSGR